jgi:hypothetical protein
MVWAFLWGRPDSLRHNEDTTATEAGASRAYWALGRGVEHNSAPSVRIKGSQLPSWLGVTTVGGSYPDGPKGGPPYAQKHFAQCSLTEDPFSEAAASRARAVPQEGKMGEVESTPTLFPPSLEDTDLAGTSIPRLFANLPVAR